MSVTNTYTGVAERDSRANDRGENANERVAVDEFVARVLDQAHQVAYAHAAPDEARVILGLAQLFADELAKTNLRFDRLRFIEAAIEEPS